MDNAKKMLLVDPARSVQMYRPVTAAEKKLSALDADIATVLNSDLADDEKAKRYIISLKQHKYYETPIIAKQDPDDATIKTVVPELRQKARRLLKHVKPHVRLSDDGEIVHNSDLIQNSDIAELLTAALTKNATERPIGWVEFADTLKRARTPKELIRNDKLWTYLNPHSKKTIKKRKWETL